MSIHTKIFEKINMKEQIELWSTNNWSDSDLSIYPPLGPKQKGSFGEKYVEGFMRVGGSVVSPPTNSGHDRVVDGYKTEIKFSLASSNTKAGLKLIDEDSFTFNHIAIGKDWERFIFFGINPDETNPNIRGGNLTKPEIRAFYMNKRDFVNHMRKVGKHCSVFKPQQGGKKANNDDYIVTGDIGKLISLSFVKPLSQWHGE